MLVFVTGASSGIGRALLDARPKGVERIVGMSRRPSPADRHVSLDLSTPGGWDAAAEVFETEISRYAGARIALFHAAGTLDPIGFAGEVDAARYRSNILLNAAAPCVLGDAFVRALGEFEGESHVVMVSSGAASHPYEGWSGYCAGKAAVDQWVRTVGAERARRASGCRVVAVAPGVVETAMQEAIRHTSPRDFPAVARFVELFEQGALRSPAEVARDLWALLDVPLDNGAVLDLRDAPLAR